MMMNTGYRVLSVMSTLHTIVKFVTLTVAPRGLFVILKTCVVRTMLKSPRSNEMTVLSQSRKDALERLTEALNEALELRRKINSQTLGRRSTACSVDYMRQLRFLCRAEMVNLKSYCGIFANTKTFIGFHNQFDILLKYACSMLKNQGRLRNERY